MKEFVARIVAQIQNTWKSLTLSQRIASSIVSGLTFILLIAVIFFSQRTVWVELGTFDLQQASQIKVELDKRGYRPSIDYRLTNEGKTIQVDAKLRNEIHLALAEKGLFGNTEKGFSIFEEFDITTTDYEQRLRTLEALKSEMRRLIRSYTQIISDVSISVPYIEHQSLFVESEIPQTASIVLTVEPGQKLDDEQIRAIRNLIAGGFPGLAPEKITITDQFARPLVPEDESSGQSSKQAKIEQDTEDELNLKISTVLGPIVGYDKFTATVDVEFDWDNVQVNQENYTVPGFDQYKVSEQTIDEKLSGQGIRPGGEPGVASNAPPVYNSIAQTGPIDYSRSEKIVNLLSDKTVTERIQSPYVKRISAAVAIDGIWKEEKDTQNQVKRTYIARTAVEMDHLKAIVASAIGQNLQRGDVIEVRNTPWDRTKEWAQLDAIKEKEEFQRKLTLYGLLTAPFIVGLFFLYAAWRRHIRIREEELARKRELERQRALAEAEAGLAGEISLEDQERQEIQRRASSLARAKPKVVADLIRTWMSEDAAAAA